MGAGLAAIIGAVITGLFGVLAAIWVTRLALRKNLPEKDRADPSDSIESLPPAASAQQEPEGPLVAYLDALALSCVTHDFAKLADYHAAATGSGVRVAEVYTPLKFVRTSSHLPELDAVQGRGASGRALAEGGDDDGDGPQLLTLAQLEAAKVERDERLLVVLGLPVPASHRY